jgi:hypothetical protein
MRGKFSLDTLAKTRLLEQAKQKESRANSYFYL